MQLTVKCVCVCVCTWAGQMASHSLQAIQRSSPEGYLVEHHHHTSSSPTLYQLTLQMKVHSPCR